MVITDDFGGAYDSNGQPIYPLSAELKIDEKVLYRLDKGTLEISIAPNDLELFLQQYIPAQGIPKEGLNLILPAPFGVFHAGGVTRFVSVADQEGKYFIAKK